jgi:ADP-ribose pyrophosphatase YjhB (NUDIX family)
MPFQQPTITDTKGRSFACFPVAILVFIVNEAEEILLLSHPARKDQWEIVKGALEKEETIIEGALRETREEIGNVQVHPFGTVHAFTVHHDHNAPHFISLFYLLVYEGGQIQPGDDMLGSQFRWWSLAELMAEEVKILVPSEKWIIQRAIELYRLWTKS